MDWLLQFDKALFRFINLGLSNPVFDVVMPFLSGNVLFFPTAVLTGLWLIWKDHVRGALCVLMLFLIVWPGDTFICNKIKHAVGRPRPYLVIPGTRLTKGKGGEVGMPSSHAANWGAATMILFLYYRRSLRIMLPLGAAVCFSRVYNGVHYPGDVLAGAVLGFTYAAILVFGLDALWRRAGKKCFPQWLERMPSLILSSSAVKHYCHQTRNKR